MCERTLIERRITMYKLITDLDKKQYDAFVEQHPYGSLLQSAGWAQVKNNWDHVFLGYEKDHELVGAAMVLIKHLPFGFQAMYVPRGPIVDFENTEMSVSFLKAIGKWAKGRRALIVKFDPNVTLAGYHIGEERIVSKQAEMLVQAFRQAGAVYHGENIDMKETAQPRFQAEVHEEDLEKILTGKHFAKMLAIADKKEVEIEIAHLEKLEQFNELMQMTSKRKEVALRDASYYQRILETYGEKAFLMFGKIPLRKQFDAICAELESVEEQLAQCRDKPKKRFTLEEKRASLKRNHDELKDLAKEQETAYLCGVLAVVYGSGSEILYAGMDERFKRYMAPYKVWLEAIRQCFAKGAKICNMGGVEGTLQDNLLQFKGNFYPVINERIGEFDLLPYPKLYDVSSKCLRLLKKLKK